jgi:hypothetical protein
MRLALERAALRAGECNANASATSLSHSGLAERSATIRQSSKQKILLTNEV